MPLASALPSGWALSGRASEVRKNIKRRKSSSGGQEMRLIPAAQRILEAMNSGEVNSALDVAQNAERLEDAANANAVLWAFMEFLAAKESLK
jgi:hypothetical protein